MNNQQLNILDNPLNKITNLLYCPTCKCYKYGNYCEHCGTKLIEVPREKRKCPHCGGTGEIDIPVIPYQNTWVLLNEKKDSYQQSEGLIDQTKYNE